MEIGSVETDVWVIVDSDGEDADEKNVSKTALKENDLVSFLNQIPFSDIFQQVQTKLKGESITKLKCLVFYLSFLIFDLLTLRSIFHSAV